MSNFSLMIMLLKPSLSGLPTYCSLATADSPSLQARDGKPSYFLTTTTTTPRLPCPKREFCLYFPYDHDSRHYYPSVAPNASGGVSILFRAMPTLHPHRYRPSSWLALLVSSTSSLMKRYQVGAGLLHCMFGSSRGMITVEVISLTLILGQPGSH